jgi:acyl-coenzyme A thioesterase PaaI-like protein
MMQAIYRRPSMFKFGLTWWAPFLGTGISVVQIAPDYSSVTVQMKSRWYNKNAFGTHFGGSLYAMVDPFYCLLLVALLGKDYYIWDKAAHIEFIKPGTGTVKAVFDWSPAQVTAIVAQAAAGEKIYPERTVDIVDEAGVVVARVHKTLYVRKKPNALPV